MTDLLEYALVRGLQGVVGALPEKGARAAGELVGRFARWPLGVRRRTVEDHLARAFPGRDRAWVEATALRCYVHFGREAGVLARLPRLGPAELVAATSEAGAARRLLRRAAGRPSASSPGDGRGVVVVTGHVGNWELAGAFLAGLGFRVSAVVKRQGNRRVHRWLSRLRRRAGIEPVPMAAAGRRLPAALEEGRIVALVADQDAGGKGVFVPFLGRPASTFRGPARLALEHDVPLVFGAMVRDADGYRALARPVWSPAGAADAPDEDEAAEATADRAGGPARPDPAGASDAPEPDETALTRRWVGELEAAIRERPEQYFWFHRRWKTRPPPDRE